MTFLLFHKYIITMKYVSILLLIFFQNSLLYSQNKYITIKGQVTNYKKNIPIQYVNVYFKQSKIGTITNNNGEFIININNELLPDSLTFSLLGYKKRTIFINQKKEKYEININLKEQVYEISQVKISAKKVNPKEILKKTYNFYKEHQKGIYNIDYYTRECIKLNNKFIYEITGFLKGFYSNKISLWEKSKFISGNLKANDSLIFFNTDTPIVLDETFEVLTYTITPQKIKSLIKSNKIKIDTVIFTNNKKIYVIKTSKSGIFYNNNMQSNYDMIINNSSTNEIIEQVKMYCNKNDKSTVKKFYKFYIEVSKNKYLIKKAELLIMFYTNDEKKEAFIKIEYNFKKLYNDFIFPNYKNFFFAYKENDTTLYCKYGEYLATMITDNIPIDNKNYQYIYNVFPTYLATKKYIIKNKDTFNNYNKQQFNYIKQDTLEYLINRDLK